MRGTKAKRLRKLGLKSGPVKREVVMPGRGTGPFDHASERRSKKVGLWC